MADQRIQATENMIGANHPSLSDTLNRLTLVQHNTDGTHGTVTGGTINLTSNTLTGTMNQFNNACSDGDFVYQGGALGTPASGNLANCTFPNLTVNTSGTAGGLSGTPNITIGTLNATTGTFSSSLSATTGTFSGSVSTGALTSVVAANSYQQFWMDTGGSNNSYLSLYRSTTDYVFTANKNGSGTRKGIGFSTTGGDTDPTGLYLNTSGNVLIGTTTDSGTGKLQVNGSAYVAGGISATGNFVGGSGVWFKSLSSGSYTGLYCDDNGISSGVAKASIWVNGTERVGVSSTGLSVSGVIISTSAPTWNGASGGTLVNDYDISVVALNSTTVRINMRAGSTNKHVDLTVA